ncbi:MAG: transketolase [Thermodesulfobacteriota bacterium]
MAKHDSEQDITERCINTIRMLSIDAIEKAKSGHPGLPMGDAAIAYVLWTGFLRHNPRNPRWHNRDRFILSAGHGSMLLYSLLYLTGYDISLDDIKQFRQWKSRTPGHPEYNPDLGVETTTGPLGQGFANGVGMAMAERYLAQIFNRPGFPVVDYHIYAMVSDGDLMEGISSEAGSLAGHLGLGKLVYIFLDNKITIDGSTDITFTEDVAKRFEAFGWHIERIDGHDCDQIGAAIERAKAEKGRPSLIMARTHIGYGSPHKQGTSEAHGAPLGAEEVRLTKEKLGWPLEPPFYVPEEAMAHFRKALEKGRELEEGWQALFTAYTEECPDLAAKWKAMHNGQLPEGWRDSLPVFDDPKTPVATRTASGKVLNSLAPTLDMLLGGSADLAASTGTLLKGLKDFTKGQCGRNVYFGVREHAMGGILNGMALSGAIVPYGGTFLIFSDQMKPAIRLAAMMKLPVICVFTHDSIGLGEDGPTHQPVEQLVGLRAIPGLTVIRPADATETVVAWKLALEQREGPVALILSRQKLPVIDRERFAPAGNLAKGGYVMADSQHGKVDLILIATGAEVHLALEAYEALTQEGIGVRVVTMPSWSLFEKQEEEYRDRVLPPTVTARLAIEAASSMGWHRYVGMEGDTICVDRFGASAPYQVLFDKFGFTLENVVKRSKALLVKRR